MIVNPPGRRFQHIPALNQQRLQSLILCGVCDILIDSQKGEKGPHFPISRVEEMVLVVEQDKPVDPLDECLDHPGAVITDPQYRCYLIQKLGLVPLRRLYRDEIGMILRIPPFTLWRKLTH